MRVFITGGTGWVGRVVVEDLLAAGHAVTGLARSDASVQRLTAAGATPLRGSLDDVGLLAEASAHADAVIHAAFDHDFSRFADNIEQERRAILALGNELVGTDKRLLVTSGLALIAPGRVVTERDVPVLSGRVFPRANDEATAQLIARGVQARSVRLATTVHGVGDRMFLAHLHDLARATGVSGYIGDGSNRWPAVHVSDAGRLYRLALESSELLPAYHASAEEGIAFREIAEAIGRGLGVPAAPRPAEHFGWLATFAGTDAPSSSDRTRAVTGWLPLGPRLLEDLDRPDYFAH